VQCALAPQESSEGDCAGDRGSATRRQLHPQNKPSKETAFAIEEQCALIIALPIKAVQYALAPEQLGKVGKVQYALPEQTSKGDCIRLLLGISAAGYANRIRLPASDMNATVPQLCSAWPYVGGMTLEMAAKGKCSTLVKA